MYFAGCAANQMLIKKLKPSLMINKKWKVDSSKIQKWNSSSNNLNRLSLYKLLNKKRKERENHFSEKPD